ncbi:MAG: amidohydrolase family protein [Mycobacterium sp.]
MRNTSRRWKVLKRLLPSLLLSLLVLAGWAFFSRPLTASPQQTPTTESEALKRFAAFQPIDVHVHVFKTDPAFQALLEQLHLKLLDILVMDDTLSYRQHLQPQVADTLELVRSSHGHIAFCTTFDPYRFNDSAFSADAIKQIDENFAQGAVAVKIWKNIGMEIKTPDGKFVMPDDPRLDPIYEDIERQGKTLMAHVAEPDVAWGPPDPSDPSWSYYQENPQWFLYGKAGFPSKKQILQARDHVLAKHPHLRMVGLHLGSMEKDLDGITRELDKYPNFAVDTAARMDYLMIAPREHVRAFFIKNQDRILYGTDLDLLATANVQDSLKEWKSTYVRDWKFLATDETFEDNGKKITGLKLPEAVLRKIFHDNARHWIPGL